MTRSIARLVALFLTAAMLLSAPGCIANLHEKTDGFRKDPVFVGLGMPIAAAVDLALLPISTPANLIYFIKNSPPARKDHRDRSSRPQRYVEYDCSSLSPDCCPRPIR